MTFGRVDRSKQREIPMRTRLPSFFAVAFLLGAAPASALSLFYNVPSPPLHAWTTVSAPLSEGSWVSYRYYDGPVATQAEVQWALGHLVGLYVLSEWYSAPLDDTNIDNVQMGGGAATSFSSGAEGWIVAGPNPAAEVLGQNILTSALTWDSAFGNPAGSARTLDTFTWTYLAAPASYLGDQSARYGETLQADLFIRFTDALPYPVFVLVAPDMVVPEPAILELLCVGIVMLAARRRPPTGPHDPIRGPRRRASAVIPSGA
jgi:hypothetical protein